MQVKSSDFNVPTCTEYQHQANYKSTESIALKKRLETPFLTGMKQASCQSV